MRTDYPELKHALQTIGHEAFPDESDVCWHVRNIVERGGFHCIEAEPVPATVGYPCFRFVIRRDTSGAFVDHGCYCLNGGAWQLLYTTPGTTGEWKALKFDRLPEP